MGTDIHPFVEVDYYSPDGEPFGEMADVRAFNRGEFFIPNVYDLLDALGNGRSRHFPPETVQRWALFPPRGLPSNASHGVVVRYSHAIVEAQSTGHVSERFPGLWPVTPERAARWVAEGWSHYYTPPVRLFSMPEPVRVSDPEWRNPSWLLLREVYQALIHFGLELEQLPLEFRTILGVMEAFEQWLGAGRTRLVFWFDN